MVLLILLVMSRSIVKRKGGLFFVSILAFVLAYLYIVGSALFEDMYCQWDVNKYDLNRNGIFESNEIDPYQEAAMRRLMDDTGRNFSVVSGLIFSFLVSLMIYGIGRMKKMIFTK